MAIPADIKIILVGANAVYLKNIRDMLSMIGYRNIEIAKDGPTGWELIKRSQPGIILSEWDMPEMNGIDAVKAIKAIDGNARVVMVSAMGQQPMVIEAIQAGAADFIVKPFQPDRVVEALNKALG